MDSTTGRKHYLDNLRAITILLSFPFHIFMIYNNWGESFYIHGEALLIPSIFNRITSFWRMPLLFAIAGISSRYALKRRSAGEYARERVSRLFLPLIFGMLLIVPVQPYIAELFFNGHGSYLDFFTKFTDLSGYNGGFAIGHLWFLLYLFVIAMVSLPFMIWYKDRGQGTPGGKTPLIFIILMGLLPCIVVRWVEIGGKSLSADMMYFLLGYIFLTNDDFLNKLEKYRFLLLGLFLLAAAVSAYFGGEFYEWVSWLGIVTIMGMARRYLDFKGKVTGYLVKSSFGVYLFHQSWIVVAAFFVFKITGAPVVQIPLIFLFAAGLTYLSYEICRRTPALRWMFGLKR